MASKKVIVEMITGIKAIYPYYAKETDVKLLVNMWASTLEEFPDDIVMTAYRKALQTCKMPPTPADVIENIKLIARANEPTDEELWAVFTKALRETSRQMYYINYPMPNTDHRQKIEDVWNSLPDKVKQYIGSKGEMMRLSQYDDNSLMFEKKNFLKTMPTIQTRIESSGLLLGGNNKLLID
jgi:hypothetical protein